MIKKVYKAPGLIVTVLFVLACLEVDALGDAGELPLEIDAFYRDFNFVSSFSTPAERVGLAELYCAKRENRINRPLSDRLKKVACVIKELNRRTWNIDPEIHIHRMKPMAHIHPAKLITVDHFRAGRNAITVQVRVCSLEPEVNQVLVAFYERYSGDRDKLPSLQQELVPIQKRAPTTEIHQWVNMDGRWILKEAKLVLPD